MARDDDRRDDELEVHLDRLARATDGLGVDPRMTDAVMARAALDRAARATEGLAPVPALSDAVMARVTAARGARGSRPQGDALARDVARTGPWAVAVAAVAAAAAVLLSFQAEQQLAGDLASTLEDAELVASLEGAP